MRILHLSDLHYGEKYKTKIERMFPPFLDKIRIINQEKKIDLVVFTGDLVWSGNKIDSFQKVKKKFIAPILKEISIEENNFIICPGNHDMSERKELPAITEYINKFSTNDELDKFVTKRDQQFDLSYEKSNHYYNFVNSYYPNDNIDKLYHTFQRKIKDKKIGIVSFHTPWRSFVGEQSEQLLLPLKIIHDAIYSIPMKDLYISLMHHPVDDLKKFNSYEVEDIIYEKFHIVFSGHYHKKKQTVIFTSDIGILSISSMSSMSGNDKSSIGFQ